ncbi:hypothetical protein DSECCO2_395930 [anaerobic digester metagenome]
MATITSEKSGNWSATTTWAGGIIPGNGDSVVIAEGHEVMFNIDQSGFANGLAGLLINGILYWDNTKVTCLKMNGNITGTGRLYVAGMWEMNPATDGYTPVSGYPNVWRDYGIAAIETLEGVRFTPADSIEEVNETPNSFYQVWEEGSHITYWNDTDSVNRYFTGINWPPNGSEYRAYILFNSTGTINVPHIQMYGEFPEREYTQLDADANAGQNQIILKEDLDLQQGDVISIGCGSENGNMTDTTKGAYTVNSYDYTTKTVTLTADLQKNRLIEDYVCIGSRPIKITRTSGTNALITAKIDDIIIKGVYINFYFISNSSSDITNMSENILADHCTSADKVLLYNVKNSIISNSSRITGGTSDLCYGVNNLLINDIGINGADLTPGNKNIIMNCVQQNTMAISTCKEARNSIFKNSGSINPNYPSTYINCEFSGIGNPTWGNLNQIFESIFIDCVFKDSDTGYFGYILPVLYHCIFEGNDINLDLKESWNNNSKIESFDHNQLPGNYKAWMHGGRIETDTEDTTILPGRLILNCESADYPVFRDFPVTLVAYRNMWWWASVLKDFTGGEVKMELIDPTADPLVDPSAVPLASYILEDVEDVLTALKLNYRSNRNMQAILRVSAQNNTGSVQLNTRLIEKRVKYGR